MAPGGRVESWFTSWGRFVVRRRWAVLGLTLAINAALASWLPRLTVDNSIEAFVLRDDPEHIRYDDFRKRFDRDDRIILILHPPRVFDLGFLGTLRRLHGEIERDMPYVEEVTSLVNARHTYGRKDELIVEDLMADWPETEADLTVLKEIVFANPLYEDILISEDGQYTIVSIKPFTYSTLTANDGELAGFDDDADPFDVKKLAEEGQAPFLTEAEGDKLVEALQAVVARYDAPDLKIHMIGGPVDTYRLSAAMSRDVTVFQTLATLITALLLYVLFRRVSGVVLPMVVVNVSLLATMGTMAVARIPMSMTIQILPAFLTVVGVCDAIHILAIVYQQMAGGSTKEEAIVFALGHSGLAVVMTSVTTAVGLLSFVFAEVAPVAELGVIAPIGVMLALVNSLVLLPALLSAIRLRPVTAREVSARGGWTERLLAWSAESTTVHPWRVLGVAALILVIFGGGVGRVYFSQNMMRWFPKGDPMRVASDLLNREFKGASALEVVIDTGRENGVQDPETLSRIDRGMLEVGKLMIGDQPINKAVSIVDVVKEINQALHENRPEYYRLPVEHEVIAQELLLFENSGSDDLEDWTDSQFRTARVTVRTPWVDAMLYPSFLASVRKDLGAALGEGMSFELTGRTSLFTRLLYGLITSLTRSYVFAFAVIMPTLVLLIGNLRRGLAAMIPNLIPVFMVLGLMGWTGIPLDTSTLLIGGIVIGLAVDDTIHFMNKFNRYYEDTGSAREAVRRTLATTGAALLFTSLVLALGFSVFMLAYMNNSFWFGLLTSFATTVAFFADILVGPALMVLLAPAAKRGNAATV